MYCDFPSFKRCCFCLPLRIGVIVFGYVNILFSTLMLGLYCYAEFANTRHVSPLIFHGSTAKFLTEICIIIYCTELVANCILVYGGHRRNTLSLKIFYYYAASTTVAGVVFELWELIDDYGNYGRYAYFAALEIASVTTCFSGLCIQLYLIMAVRSLLKKVETASDHQFDNQLNMVLSGEREPPCEVYINTNIDPAAYVERVVNGA